MLAFSAIRNNDKVGLIIFTDRVEQFIPPKKGRSHVLRVIRELLSFQPHARAAPTSTARWTTSAGGAPAGGGVPALRLPRPTATTSGCASPPAVTTSSPSPSATAAKPSCRDIGLIELEDAESGETLLVDTYDRNTTDGLRVLSRDERDVRRNLFRSAGAGEIEVWTDEPYVDTLVRFFRAREKRR